MAKWSGYIGYATQVEQAPDVWVNEIVERKARGDLLRRSRRLQSTDQVTDNIVLSNEISIVAGPFARDHHHEIVYVRRKDVKWKVTSATFDYPRINLTLGGVYNG